MTENQSESRTTGNNSSLITIVITAAIFLVVGIVLTTVFNGDTVSPDELDSAVNKAVGTQMAAQQPVVQSGDGASISQAELDALIDQAVGTQVAALRPTNTPIPPTPTRVPNTTAADDDAFHGPADAPVVIVEFSDFQCGYCGRFYNDTLPQILETYPDDVKFVYRDFPIFGEDSVRAAMATECVEEQDKFWEMHNRIFDSRRESDPAPLSQETLVSYATQLELDTDAFAECLASERYMDEVIGDYQAASGYGFSGTPAFLINGIHMSGAQPFANFQAIIESELAAAN